MVGSNPAGAPMVSPVTGAACPPKRAPKPRPMGEVIGRQPSFIQINPSRQYPWYGAIVGGQVVGFGGHSITGGERFTEQQIATLRKRKLAADKVEAMAVRRNSTDREIYCPLNQLRGVYEFECPVVSRQADGRCRIIAPSGEIKLVEADGWTEPYRRGALGGRS